MALRLLDTYVLNNCQNVIKNPDILTHILPLLKEQDCVQMVTTITIYDYLLAVGVQQQQNGKSKVKDLVASMYKKEIFLILFSLF